MVPPKRIFMEKISGIDMAVVQDCTNMFREWGETGGHSVCAKESEPC